MKHPVVQFFVRTMIYFFLFLALLYLYGYLGLDQGNFIYNEF